MSRSSYYQLYSRDKDYLESAMRRIRATYSGDIFDLDGDGERWVVTVLTRMNFEEAQKALKPLRNAVRIVQV